MRQGLMPRVGHGDHHGWGSRDYLEGIPCACVACFCNDKKGRCGQPAMAQLNGEGQCQTYLDFKDKPPVLPPRKCRVCGGRVKQEAGKWVHDGEKLSHDVVV